MEEHKEDLYGIPYDMDEEDRRALRDHIYGPKRGRTKVKRDYYFRQYGLCAICMNNLPGVSSAHLDHCHTTGKYRGLLCHACNVGLGFFKDSTDNLQRAMDYLRSNE